MIQWSYVMILSYFYSFLKISIRTNLIISTTMIMINSAFAQNQYQYPPTHSQLKFNTTIYAKCIEGRVAHQSPLEISKLFGILENANDSVGKYNDSKLILIEKDAKSDINFRIDSDKVIITKKSDPTVEIEIGRAVLPDFESLCASNLNRRFVIATDVALELNSKINVLIKRKVSKCSYGNMDFMSVYVKNDLVYEVDFNELDKSIKYTFKESNLFPSKSACNNWKSLWM